MNTNLLSLAQQALGGNFSSLAGQFLGESPESTQSAMSSLVPAVLGLITRKGSTPEGASGLMSLISGANLDVKSLDNVAGLFGSGGAGIGKLLNAGSGSLVPALLGDKSGALAHALSSSSGIKSSSATSLVAMVVPLILTFLKKFIGEKGFNPSLLAGMLASQGPNLQGAIDPRMAGALGIASPSAFVGGVGGNPATASGAIAADEASGGKTGMMRWLPWLIGAAVVLFGWSMFKQKPEPMPADVLAPQSAVQVAPVSPPEPTPAPPAAAALPQMPAKVHFAIGSAAIDADGSATVAAVADMVKKDRLKITITGHTDKTGDAAKNAELAKRRAIAVRDALMAAGVAEADIALQPPAFVEVGVGGSDAEARRVEIARQ